MSIEAPVQRQLEAYNAHNLEYFAAQFAEEVQAFRPPSTDLLFADRAAFNEHYAKRFAVPDLHVTVVNRIISGNRVVDHERIVGLGDETIEAIVVYEVEDEIIQKVWFF